MFIERMTVFRAEAEPRVAELEDRFKALTDGFADCAKFFGETETTNEVYAAASVSLPPFSCRMYAVI